MKKAICVFLFLMISHLFISAKGELVDKQVLSFQTMGDFTAVIYITHSIDNHYKKNINLKLLI